MALYFSCLVFGALGYRFKPVGCTCITIFYSSEMSFIVVYLQLFLATSLFVVNHSLFKTHLSQNKVNLF